MVNPNDPAEKELAQLMAEDDAAVTEVDKWIQANNTFAAQGAGESKEALNQRIRARLDHGAQRLRGFFAALSGFRARASGLWQLLERYRGRGSGGGAIRKGRPARPEKSGGMEQPRQLLRRTRPDHQCLRGLRQSHRVEPGRTGVLPESRHHGLSFPQGRAGVLRHQRAAGFRQGARVVSQGHRSWRRKISRSRPITRKAITASARSAPTMRSGRGRTRSKSPTTTTNAKAFTSIWPGSKWPSAVLPRPARN